MSYSIDLFNKYKWSLDNSRNHFVSMILRCRPDFAASGFSDEAMKPAYDSWNADGRAMDAALGTSYHKQREMLAIPPNDEGRRACRHMWSVTMERHVNDGHVSLNDLKAALDHLKSTEAWEYHDRSCGCHSMRAWENCYGDEANLIHDFSTLPFGNTMTICKLPTCPCCAKEDALVAEIYKKTLLREEAESKEAELKASWAFVKSYGYDMQPRIHDQLFGHYTVQQTASEYIFTLMEPANRRDWKFIGKKTVVPLSVKMGEGDFVEVTPKKISVA